MAVVTLAPRAESSTLCYVSAKDYERYWVTTATLNGVNQTRRRPKPVQLELPFGDPHEPPCITPTS